MSAAALQETYIAEMTKCYSNRIQDSIFEIHRFPDVPLQTFLELISKYGMRKTNNEMEGVPCVHFVMWNEASPYYESHLKTAIADSRKRILAENEEFRLRYEDETAAATKAKKSKRK